MWTILNARKSVFVGKLQQAGEIDNFQQVCGVFGMVQVTLRVTIRQFCFIFSDGA